MSYSMPHVEAISSAASGLTAMQANGPGVSHSELVALLPRSVPNRESYVLAQSFDQDVLGDIKNGFTNFVETGQVWALLIGLVVGFVIRGLTR